ncbi:MULTISPECIES: DnaB-like helicase C-terminal domain-containing protein [Streptomyces]|uniref:DnaB-like helicase C-terminal domain-containing protein n=1 Tax=Streptomyces TaxID=1883 RepID=UPI001E477B03|nr:MULTISPECIES: DnaB-like helicase C-terminal domain-containing protein [Streptomyces]UFQ19939.1 DnaB-like helicase C-terminal domain-containing protein [Streptomyces huasconensis]WCL89561.1 DnaB-like helicase C-terminal domain-containing protein [Streptomyces sp. JCM 35825]
MLTLADLLAAPLLNPEQMPAMPRRKGQGLRQRHAFRNRGGRALKALARELAVPVVFTAPVRAVSRQPHWMPAPENLHDEVVFAADTVVLVHREEAYNRTARPMVADLVVAKARNSRPTITADIAFRHKISARAHNFVFGGALRRVPGQQPQQHGSKPT